MSTDRQHPSGSQHPSDRQHPSGSQHPSDRQHPSGQPPAPMTRAEARAQREAIERAPHETAAHETTAHEAAVHETAARDEPPSNVAAPGAPTSDHRRFVVFFAAVIGVLAITVAVLSAVSLVQGPRLSSVQVDPAGAIESSGSRIILTANQALAPVTKEQVSVEPEVPFTLDTAGRGVGVRFTVPLDDDTKYSVRVNDVEGIGGGATAVLETSFRTPTSRIFILQRDVEGDDTIFISSLSGEDATPVFQHPQITDFRATASRLVVSVEAEGTSTLLVMNRDGSDERELPLPGTGFASTLQVSERGGLVGYTYTDQKLTATDGRASVLVTQSLHGDQKPRVVEVADVAASVASWQFVPDAAAALFIDFAGALFLDDRTGEAGPQPLGLAQNIQGISRGTYTAVIERSEGLFTLDLADGTEQSVASATPDYGLPISIVPFPGGELRHIVQRDGAGIPTGQLITRVEDGEADVLFEVSGTEAILQTCASPSGRYTAVTVARDLRNNAYDRSLLPMPESVQTHILDTRSGEEQVVLAGFDISWCAKGPGR